MEFPEAERVIYSRNPLAEVACQLRFPRILALDERIPAEFQAALGAQYPFVDTREVVQFSFQFGGEAPVKRVHYEFSTEDRGYTVTLSSEFIAVTTRSYTRWEEFSRHLVRALEALLSSYAVSIFTRVGLRYVDVISRSKLDLDGVRWSELIRRSALGLLAEDEVPIDSVMELSAATVVKLDAGGKATIRTALGQTEATGPENVFIVDSDFFQDEPVRGSNDAVALCAGFNRSAGRAFRWIIHDRLHDALDPRSPEQS